MDPPAAATSTATTSPPKPIVSKFASYGGNRDKCTICLLPTYPLERMVLNGSSIHKSCFKCNYCKQMLTLSNFASVNGLVFCKPHYIRMFKESGGKYDVFGAFVTKKPGVAAVAAADPVPPPEPLPGMSPVAVSRVATVPSTDVLQLEEEASLPEPVRRLVRKNSEPELRRTSVTLESKLLAFLASTEQPAAATAEPPQEPPGVTFDEEPKRGGTVVERVRAIAQKTSGRVRRMSAPTSQLSDSLRRIGSRTQELMRAYIPAAAGTAGHEDTAEPVGLDPAPPSGVEEPSSLAKYRLRTSVKERLKWLERLSSRASFKRADPVHIHKGAAAEAKLRYLTALAQKSEPKSPVHVPKSASAAKAEYLAAAQPDSPRLSPLLGARVDAKQAYLAAAREKRPLPPLGGEPPATRKDASIAERAKAYEEAAAPRQEPEEPASHVASIAERAKAYEDTVISPARASAAGGGLVKERVAALLPASPSIAQRAKAYEMAVSSPSASTSPSKPVGIEHAPVVKDLVKERVAALSPAGSPVKSSPTKPASPTKTGFVKERAALFADTTESQQQPHSAFKVVASTEVLGAHKPVPAKERIIVAVEPSSVKERTVAFLTAASPPASPSKEAPMRSFNEGGILRRTPSWLRAQRQAAEAAAKEELSRETESSAMAEPPKEEPSKETKLFAATELSKGEDPPKEAESSAAAMGLPKADEIHSTTDTPQDPPSSLKPARSSFSKKKVERRAGHVSFGNAEFHEILAAPASDSPADEPDSSPSESDEGAGHFRTASGASARKGSALASYLSAMEDARKAGRPPPLAHEALLKTGYHASPESPPPIIPPSPPTRVSQSMRPTTTAMVLESPSDSPSPPTTTLNDAVTESLEARAVIAAGKRRRPSSTRLLKGTSLDDLRLDEFAE